MAGCIRRLATKIVGVSRGGSGRMKGPWWWSKEVKEKVKAKWKKYKALVSSRTNEGKEDNKVQYKIAKREAKKVLAIAKNDAY